MFVAYNLVADKKSFLFSVTAYGAKHTQVLLSDEHFNGDFWHRGANVKG